MIKVSIIIPVYNVERYIVRCVDSVLTQSYRGVIECIFIDDCTPCRSIEIIEGLISQHTLNFEFKILHHEENRGLSAGRNSGIKAATGDYIYFLDSDDDITAECIENLVALAETYRGVDLVQGRIVSHFDGVNRDDCFDEFDFPEYSCDKSWIYSCYFPQSRMSPMAWNKLIKRDFVIENELWFKEGIVHEDTYWTQIVAAHINSIAFCHIPSYIYRDNPDSIMTCKYRDRSIISWLMIFEEIFLYPPTCLINSRDIILGGVLKFVLVWRDIESYPLEDIDKCTNFYKKTLHRLVKSPKVSFRHKIGFSYMLLPKWMIRIRVVSFLFNK
ncbi:MAG: glycosyltransferase family 2 protein [Rikenellaceae bacterium]